MRSEIVLLTFAAVASAAGLPPPPPPISGYVPAFGGLACASHDDSYQTYYLVNTIMDCATECNADADCAFFNTYHDTGKGSTQLTCALFSKCLPAASATNCGTGISESSGYCKVVTIGS
ncbi:hypothetical protein K438DRAFT_1970832 [Mycena galopus ATCC 62051]|nr:hypothetical protein K438DRAFT_1970832 [Mycena galopus ATCC 62051]